MIKKLRLKFIIILMSVVTLILLAVFVSMLLSTWGNASYMSENMLKQALNRHPSMQEPPPPQNKVIAVRNNPHSERLSILIAEVDINGEIYFLTNQLHFFDEAEAKAVVQTAINTNKHFGILREQRLRFLKSDDERRVAFADISMEQDMFNNLMFNSLMIGIVALVIFFFVSLFLSRWAVKPVELAWKRQREFVADASHELKTPLTVILSNADMLSAAGTFSDEKKKRRMEHISAEAVRMSKLVEDLLTLAKSDSTENKLIQESVDFSFIVTSVLLTFEPIVFDEKKELFYDVQDEIVITGDSQRLQQFIVILMDNAVKYCKLGGQINVTLREFDKKSVIFTVFNEGEPIPVAELSQIFQRFYRIDKSRSNHSSFGLGLSIAENIVKEHRGKIWAESIANKGNEFSVILPLS